jgi:hypothetical protein
MFRTCGYVLFQLSRQKILGTCEPTIVVPQASSRRLTVVVSDLAPAHGPTRNNLFIAYV